jgi:hypothetical protein
MPEFRCVTVALAAYDEHVASLVTAAGVWQVIMDKGFANLVAEDTQISVEQMMVAAREMGRLGQGGQDDMRWARQQAQLARILAAFRALPEPFRAQVLAVAEGRTPAQPGGAPQLALDVDTDTGFTPFGDDEADYDDED